MSTTGGADELLIRAAIADELSGPLQAINAEVTELTAAVERLETAGGTRLPQGVARGRSALGQLSTIAHQAHGRLLDLSRSAGETMVNATRRLAVGLAVLAAATTAFGFKAASNFEQTRIALDGMLGSAAKGQALFSSLQDLNKRTPFELQDITAGARQLIGFQFDPKQVVPIMKASTDIAAGLGAGSEGLQRILLNLGQVQAAGKVTGRELRDFAVLGVPGYALVANILGKTRDQVIAMGDNATVSADKFVAAWTSMQGPLAMFGGMAEKQMDSIQGLWSNVKDAVTVGLAGAAKPLVEAAKPLLKTVLPNLITEGIGSIAPPLIKLGTTILSAVARLLPILLPIFTALANGAVRLLDAMAPGFAALAPVADDIAASLVELVDALVPEMPTLVDAFVQLVRVLPEFVRLLADLVPLIAPVLRLVDGILRMQGTPKILADVLLGIVAYRAVAGVAGTIFTLVRALSALRAVIAGGTAIEAATGAVGAAEAAGGIGGITGILSTSGAAAAGAAVGWAALAVAIGAAVYGLDQWLNKGRLSAAVAGMPVNPAGTAGAPPAARAARETAEKADADRWLKTGRNPDAARFGDAFAPNKVPTAKARATAQDALDAYTGKNRYAEADQDAELARQGWRQNKKTGALEWIGGPGGGLVVNGPLVHADKLTTDVDVEGAVNRALRTADRNHLER